MRSLRVIWQLPLHALGLLTPRCLKTADSSKYTPTLQTQTGECAWLSFASHTSCLTVAGTCTVLFHVIDTFSLYWNDCRPTEHICTWNNYSQLASSLSCDSLNTVCSAWLRVELPCSVTSRWQYKFRFRYRGRGWRRPCSLAFFAPSNIPISFVLLRHATIVLLNCAL